MAPVGWGASLLVPVLLLVIVLIVLLLGEKYIRARKFQKGPTDTMYVSTDREYNLHSEDIRLINMKGKELVARRSSRSRQSVTSSKTYELDNGELDKLRTKCWRPDLGEICL